MIAIADDLWRKVSQYSDDCVRRRNERKALEVSASAPERFSTADSGAFAPVEHPNPRSGGEASIQPDLEKQIYTCLNCHTDIDELNAAWRKAVAREEQEPSADMELRLRQMFEKWLTGARMCLELAAALKLKGHELAGLDQLIGAVVAVSAELEDWKPAAPSIFPTYRTIRNSIEARARLKARMEQAILSFPDSLGAIANPTHSIGW